MDHIPISQTLIRNIIKDQPGPGPVTATYAITSYCNLRCEFCWCHSSLNKERPKLLHVPAQRVIADIKDLANMGTKEIVLSAKGEATCHPEFAEIVNAAKDEGLSVKLLTNFSNWSPNIISAGARADNIIINLGAVDAKSYQDIHSPDSSKTYYRLIKNIRHVTLLRASRSRPLIEICYIITKNNFRYIEKAIELARSLGIPSIRFRSVQTTPQTGRLSLNAEERRELFHNITKLLQQPLKVRNNLKSIAREFLSKKNISVPFEQCFIGWLDIYIELDGSVWSCCQNSSFELGNCRTKSLQDIWGGPKAQRFRLMARDHMRNKKYFGNDCRYCRHAETNCQIEKFINAYNARKTRLVGR